VTNSNGSSDPVIALSGVSRRFNGLWAVRDLSMSVPAGSIVGLIGPSGSGKTTTVRLLTGTLRPNHGEARVLGEDPQRFSRRTRERIAYMPQLFSLYPDLTARENVGFVAALYGISWFGRRGRIQRRSSRRGTPGEEGERGRPEECAAHPTHDGTRSRAGLRSDADSRVRASGGEARARTRGRRPFDRRP